LKKRKILVICDSPRLVTGLARVGKEVSLSLSNAGFDVSYLACNGDNTFTHDKFPFKVYPYKPNDKYGAKRFATIVEEFLPDFILAIGDIDKVGYVGQYAKKFNVYSVYYCPVEGELFPSGKFLGKMKMDYIKMLNGFDEVVTYSEFGKKQINDLIENRVSRSIPHGVDLSIFKPLDTFEARNNLGIDVAIGDCFIVGAIYRNCTRKSIDKLFEAFSIFKHKYCSVQDFFGVDDIKDDVDGSITGTVNGKYLELSKMPCYITKEGKLIHDEKIILDQDGGSFNINRKNAAMGFIAGTKYFNIGTTKKAEKIGNLNILYYFRKAYLLFVTDPFDSYGWNFEDLSASYDIVDSIIICPITGGKTGLDDVVLRNIYSSSNVHVMLSKAEGWGLPHLESLASGTRAMATDYATPAEYGQGVLDLVPIIASEIVPIGVRWVIADVDAVAYRFKQLAEDPNIFDIYEKGVEFVKDYSWELVNKKWIKLFKTAIPKRFKKKIKSVIVDKDGDQEPTYLDDLDKGKIDLVRYSNVLAIKKKKGGKNG